MSDYIKGLAIIGTTIISMAIALFFLGYLFNNDIKDMNEKKHVFFEMCAEKYDDFDCLVKWKQTR